MLASAVVAGFAGTVVAVKLWWRRALGKFRRRQPSQVETVTGSDHEG